MYRSDVVPSLMVLIDLSISDICSCIAATFNFIESNLFSKHLNSLSLGQGSQRDGIVLKKKNCVSDTSGTVEKSY